MDDYIGDSIMSLSSLNWDNASKTLTLNIGRVTTVRKSSNTIFIDDGRGGGEQEVGNLTGSPSQKKQQLIDWINQNIFMNIVLLTDLPIDDPDRSTDPNTARAYWSDEFGVKDVAGDYVTYVAAKVTDFDNDLLAIDDTSGITITRMRQ